MAKENNKRGKQTIVALVLIPAIFILVGGIVVMNYAMDRPLLSVPFLQVSDDEKAEAPKNGDASECDGHRFGRSEPT
ncbi:MAG: hypothetical protein HZT42_07935 [Paracoccaceae bacterium]|nr:MAG: hypothetical protein HZT42_07935 [Paracoccaceae bacterium]